MQTLSAVLQRGCPEGSVSPAGLCLFTLTLRLKVFDGNRSWCILTSVSLLCPARCPRLFKLGGPDPQPARDVRRAVLLVSSVKTLPVAVTVLGKLAPVLGEAAVGIAVVPCVLAHLGQIIWDSLMVSHIKQADDRAAAAAGGSSGGKQQ